MRKESQRQARCRQLGNARFMAQQPGRVPGIEVTDGSQPFVIATGKHRTGADTSRGVANAAIQLQADLDHGVGLVSVFLGQQLRPGLAQRALRCGYNPAILILLARNIQYGKQHSGRAYPHEIVTISSGAAAVIEGSQLRFSYFRGLGMRRRSRTGSSALEWKQLPHGVSATQSTIQTAALPLPFGRWWWYSLKTSMRSSRTPSASKRFLQLASRGEGPCVAEVL